MHERMEDALRTSEARLRQMADAMPQIVWITTAAGRVEYFNQRWTEYTTLPVEQGLGDAWAGVLHADDRDLALARWEQSLRTGQRYEDEYRLRRHDGEYRWQLARGEPVRDDAGRIAHWFGTCTDIHEHKMTLDALRHKQEQLALTLEVARAGSFEWNIRDDVNWWSPELEALYGLPAGSFGGSYHAWAQCVFPEDLPLAEERVRESMQTGKFYTDFRIRRPDGEVRWIQARARVLSDEQQRPLRMVGINLDVTDQKLAEEEARIARDEAERANNAKDEFLAALSHELRTPLTPVMMMSQVLERDPALPEQVRQDMRVIRRNVELETRLIDDLLDLTRISRGKLQLHTEPVEVHGIVQDAIRTCNDDLAAEKRLRFNVRLDARYATVWADATRLSQVLWNLLKNAIKFSRAGGLITVHTSNPTPERIRITVSDVGVGIEPAFLPHVFNAFEQGGSGVTRRFGGLGLGLAICRALTQMHQGTIVARSAGRDQGATFEVELPTATVAAATGSTEPADLGHEGSRRAPRLLLVEDHDQTARLLERLLKGLGYDIGSARTLTDALDLASRRPFDLVLSDLGLPDGSGLDLMRELRQRHGLKGIALTGYGMEKDIADSAAAGFVEHLVKPVSLDQLHKALERHARPRALVAVEGD